MIDKAFRTSPFMRVLFPLAGGIILARQITIPEGIIWFLLGFQLMVGVLLYGFSVRPSVRVWRFTAFRYGLQAGIYQGMFLCLGLILGREKDVLPLPETLVQAVISVVPSSWYS